MRVIQYLLVLISLILIVNSQSSPNHCSYGGIDYSFLSNSTGYSTTDQQNFYTYYFNVCQRQPKCNTMSSGNIVACQVKNFAGSYPTSVGNLNQGAFSISNNITMLSYKTASSPCSNGLFRSFNIHLVPSYSSSPIVSQAVEESKCTYGVTIKYPQENQF